MDYKIKLSLPHIGGSEKRLVAEAIDSTWIVPLGPFVDRFENELRAFLETDKSVVALSSGTAAIHLGLLCAGVKEGDEVICQSMTFSASANPIKYIGAKPVFIDSETETWNMDAALLEKAINDRFNITGRYPAAIVVVHLYGMPANLSTILSIARKYDIPVIEDAAEAIGSRYDGKLCGTFGSFGILSFNGNKMITTSGGGALICPDNNMAKKAKFLATQAREDKPYYYHETIGYNYRLSNISAAIGCAQMEVLNSRIERRKEICGLYSNFLRNNKFIEVHLNPYEIYDSNYWLTTLLLRECSPISAEYIRQKLAEIGIESRLLWRPMHMQPVFADCPSYLNGVSEKLFNHGLCLPSSTTLSDEEIFIVAKEINKLFE